MSHGQKKPAAMGQEREAELKGRSRPDLKARATTT